mmetsp:Transcript_6255/g.17969  ORF Transcript_6255/g.17969 Transcript_6255/m.17969 type:complete len:275 (-) Transcript_6255:233-1057(-)|eukprot:CAMPEP_0206145962 /NCGR_PEP_ID=MMETSP1473-20131121/29079_1 /ASSEMBLY_ACC=CAM_ASM_001109 /TAXON_ID=1461547 /ORGANISM="Stichococcus sp, Strain RCC1054" /LENGTH=274 /DNA_ID=CAMNT_0053542369 /DNA_START=224 /DNA_END=1048 /DNA_ORIENTATION=-
MAGINRLGKGAPKPRVHAPDLNRNRTLDFFSEETGKLESDRDYQRTVQDIEDAAQTQGWLFSRGAFDKTDLLYLRDQEEKSRHTEMELHDKEVMAYAQLRMQSDKQKPAPGLGIAGRKIEKERNARPPGKVQPRIIKISKAGGAAAGAGQAGARSATAAGQATPLAQAPQESAPAASPAAAGGLGDLLGGYGSGSDSEPDSGGDGDVGGGGTGPLSSAAAEEAQLQPQAAAVTPTASLADVSAGSRVVASTVPQNKHVAEEEVEEEDKEEVDFS